MKQRIALLLAVLMLLSVFAGCTSGKVTETQEPENKQSTETKKEEPKKVEKKK